MATKKAARAAGKSKNLEQIEKDQRKERKMIHEMAQREQFMKWLLVGVIILLLLLLLFLGYATDWLRGISKDSATKTPVTTSLDSAAGTGTTGTGAAGTTSGGTTNTGTTNTGRTSTTDASTGNTNTTRESTSSTTTNNTTTTNNNTTPGQNSGLLNLYADTSVGDNISSLLDDASLLGLSNNCRNEVLIQVCEITDGTGLEITTRNLLGTGIITSITKNF